MAVQLEVPVDNTITRIFDTLVGNSAFITRDAQKFPARCIKTYRQGRGSAIAFRSGKPRDFRSINATSQSEH